ncbi:unnamed protein product [marine sediment metagenome]|uniref:Uncharacterized protein n=1 Tax=marine sediment metagenome TaxID=412755 RepID=X0T5F8_9ZZZZ
MVRLFIEDNGGHYYAALAEKLLAEMAAASGSGPAPTAAGTTPASPLGKSAARPSARPRVGHRPTAEGLREFDGRLRARLAEALRAGGKPVFTYSKLRTRMRVLKLGDGDVLAVRGVRIPVSSDVAWSSLTIGDRAGLALGLLREGVAADHALAAFFLFASGRTDDAREHLARAGEKSGVLEALGD